MKGKLRRIPAHELCQSVGQELSWRFWHSTPSRVQHNQHMCGIGKKMGWSFSRCHPLHQKCLSNFGEVVHISDDDNLAFDTFDVYNADETNGTSDHVNYWHFCRKQWTLPPLSDIWNKPTHATINCTSLTTVVLTSCRGIHPFLKSKELASS